jgi:hypothetical protein
MGRAGSGSCPVTDCGVNCVEHSRPATTVSVNMPVSKCFILFYVRHIGLWICKWYTVSELK